MSLACGAGSQPSHTMQGLCGLGPVTWLFRAPFLSSTRGGRRGGVGEDMIKATLQDQGEVSRCVQSTWGLG